MKPDLSALPPTERLTASRPEAPIWFKGKLVLPSSIKKSNAQAPSLDGLTQHEVNQALTAARNGKKPTYKPANEIEHESMGGYVAFNDEGECLGFISYDYNPFY